MNKLVFEDKSYIEISKSNSPGMIFVTIAAKSAEDTKTLIINSVELSVEDFLKLASSAK